jgi:hypothetical protein
MSFNIVCSQQAYRETCNIESSIPLFSQAWWLDAVAGDSWDAVLVYDKGQVVGALPFMLCQSWGLKLLSQPKLTQTLGPWVRPSEAKYANALAFEKDVLGALADGLPQFDMYRQNWDCARLNWLPFYWRGYQQTTRYTYVLSDISNTEQLWTGFQRDIRGNIRKAEERFGVTVRFSEDIDDLIPVLRKTFERQGSKLPFSDQFLRNVDQAATAKNKRAIVLGEDAEGKLHAGTYIVWEGDTAYQLLNGYDPELRQSGAGSLCVWSAIQKASQYVNRYDFEGSMLEPVERFFRAFGARQVPYLRLERTDSRILRARFCAANILRKRR